MKKMTRLMALVLCLVLCVGLLAGCGSSSTDETTTDATDTTDTGEDAAAAETADDGSTKTFTFGTDANSTTFDPAADLQTNSGGALVSAVIEPLWTIGTDGSVELRLAESYEWTSDLELTVTIQSGITFSNGNALTSDDVLYTLEHLRDTSRTSSMVATIDYDATYCPDDYTIVIVLTEYDASLFDTLGNASNGILDRETCEANPDFTWLIGTGPYKLQGDGISDTSGWTESVQYTLVRNEDYWGDAPYYDEVIIKFYSEESTRYADLQAGNLDAAYLTEATYINSIDAGSVAGATLVKQAAQGVQGLSLHSSVISSESSGEITTEEYESPLLDINVRMAVAHALDIPTIVETLGEGTYDVATSILGEDNWAYLDVGTYEYDPEYAAECLAEAGYSVDNPLTLTLVAESASFNTALAEACQAYLAVIGINLDLSGMGDFATILPTLLTNEMDVCIGSPSNGSGTDPASLLQQFGPASDNGLMRQTDSTLSSLFSSGSSSRDTEERVSIYAEFQQEMYDQYRFIPLYTETKSYGVKSEHTSFADALNVTNMLDVTLLTD
ncbi:MAG: ABC transporter substrate-binding protein [Oscillospiraceae bacterium]|nr:ABC transporter substrate-binding protein [Oscillospiraceae bacterium]